MVPINITFRHTPVSSALTKKIREKAVKLERFYSHIIDCEVVVDATPTKNKQATRIFSVRINLVVPGQTISVHEVPESHKEQEDVYVTVNKAFHTARRRLEDFVRIHHQKVKRHSLPFPDTTIVNEEESEHEYPR